MIITLEFLHQYLTKGIGCTRKQAAVLGISYPLRHGWRRRLLGTKISEEKVRQLRALIGVTAKSERSNPLATEEIHRLKPGQRLALLQNMTAAEVFRWFEYVCQKLLQAEGRLAASDTVRALPSAPNPPLDPGQCYVSLFESLETPPATVPPTSFTCPDCGWISHDTKDIADRYCAQRDRAWPEDDDATLKNW